MPGNGPRRITSDLVEPVRSAGRPLQTQVRNRVPTRYFGAPFPRRGCKLHPCGAGLISLATNIAIIALCVAAAVLFLFFVSRTATGSTRKESNDFTGAVVAVIGTTYAVILAFTLSGVWSMFQSAQANEEQEANALVNVYRISMQLQDESARKIQQLCMRYADNALHTEWPQMEREAGPWVATT